MENKSSWNNGGSDLYAGTNHCSIFVILIDFGVRQSRCLAGRRKLKIQSHDGSIRKPNQIRDTWAELWMRTATPQNFSGIPDLHKTHIQPNPAMVFKGHVYKIQSSCDGCDVLQSIYFQTKDAWTTFPKIQWKMWKLPALCHCVA